MEAFAISPVLSFSVPLLLSSVSEHQLHITVLQIQDFLPVFSSHPLLLYFDSDISDGYLKRRIIAVFQIVQVRRDERFSQRLNWTAVRKAKQGLMDSCGFSMEAHAHILNPQKAHVQMPVH